MQAATATLVFGFSPNTSHFDRRKRCAGRRVDDWQTSFRTGPVLSCRIPEPFWIRRSPDSHAPNRTHQRLGSVCLGGFWLWCSSERLASAARAAQQSGTIVPLGF